MPTSVADLLARSRASHRNGKDARARREMERSVFAFREAQRLRLEAAALDPDQSDPAWAEEDGFTGPGKNTHESLLAFYAQVLG
jgi:hypothetical protein